MKRQGSTELPRFVVGALAITGASAASGATVQIAFANNVLSTEPGYNIAPDLTDDGVADVGAKKGFINGPWCYAFLYRKAISAPFANASVRYSSKVGGTLARVRVWNSSNAGTDVNEYQFRGLVPFGFSKSGVNGGLQTVGWLDVTSTAVKGASGAHSASVQIHRLIFDDASTVAPTGVSTGGTYNTWSASVAAVPEPSSSLALLALGAGGLLMRRRL